MNQEDYTYTTYEPTTTTTTSTIDPGFFAVYSLFWLVVGVLLLVSFWRLFTKAGKPGWAAIIPFYNTWVMVEIARLSVVWFVLTFIPLVNIVAAIVIYNGLSKAFGRGAGTTVLMIFFPYVMFPVLAFGKAQYVGAAADNLAATGVTNTPPTTPAA